MSSNIPIQASLRCQKCGKLLAKNSSNGSFEIKCGRCGTLNSLLEQSSQQIIITDPEGIILYTNDALEKITGYASVEVIGRKPSVWGGQMPGEFYSRLWDTVKNKKQSFRVVVHNKRKDGSIYVANLQVSPILDSNGEILFLVGVENPI